MTRSGGLAMGWAFSGALALLAIQVFAAPTVAVIATDKCDQASTLAHSRSYRQALGAQLGDALQSEADSIARLGGAPRQFLSLGEVERLLTGATADVFQDQTARALRTLTGVAEDVERLPPSEARFRALVDILSLVGHIHLKNAKLDSGAEAKATADFVRILRVDPKWGPNIDLYPPSTRNFVAQLRTMLKKQANGTLTVTTRPRGLPVYVDAKPIGLSPQTISLLTGLHLVEVDWGQGTRGLARNITVGEQPVEIELDRAFEGSIFPDRVCVHTDGSRQARLTIGVRVAALLGVQTVHAIREEEPAEQERFVTAVTLNSYGEERVEGRIKLHAGSLSPSAWDSFVSFMLTGDKPQPPVEAVRPAFLRSGDAALSPREVSQRGSFSRLRTVAYISGAVGLGATAATIGFSVQANNANRQIAEICMGGPCPNSASFDDNLARTRSTSSTWAIASGVVAVTAITTGLILFVLSISSPDPHEHALLLEPDGAGFLVRF